jgi:hypothetical protein
MKKHKYRDADKSCVSFKRARKNTVKFFKIFFVFARAFDTDAGFISIPV